MEQTLELAAEQAVAASNQMSIQTTTTTSGPSENIMNVFKREYNIYLIVVLMLGGAGILTIIASVILVMLGRDVPAPLWTLAAGGLSALGGLLAPAPSPSK
jgi:hypothetical protein